MAGEDAVIRDAALRTVLNSLSDRDSITYRQDILRDAMANREVVRQIYALAVEAIDLERKNYFGVVSRFPGAVLIARST